MKGFSGRVWYEIGNKTPDGKPMWASRIATDEDRKEHRKYWEDYRKRQAERVAAA